MYVELNLLPVFNHAFNYLNEGQADWFAESLFPELQPQWNRLVEHESEEALWAKIKPVLCSKDPDLHNTFMFGDETKGLPWCIGYVFGRLIVRSYLQGSRFKI
jgi:uncharacterized protein YjaZ